MKRVEEYFVLRDSSSVIKPLKLDCHSIFDGKAVLRHPGVLEEYEIASIHTYRGKTKDVIEYELGACLKCLKLEEAERRCAV